MTDEVVQRHIAEGARARAILSDPLVEKTLSAMRQAICDSFFATESGDSALRERLHMMHRAQRQFEAAFQELILYADAESRMASEEAMQRRASELIDEQLRSR